MKKTAWMYLLIGIGVFVLTFLFTGVGFQYYVDIPSFVISPVLGLILTCMAHGVEGVRGAYMNAFNVDISTNKAKKSIAVFKGFMAMNWYAAGFGSVAGIVAILTDVTDVRIIASSIAVAILCTFYTIVFNLFFILPFKSHLEAAAAEKE